MVAGRGGAGFRGSTRDWSQASARVAGDQDKGVSMLP